MTTASLELVDTACLAGECEKSIGLLEQAVQLRPHDFRLHYRLGQCYGGWCRSHPLVHPDMAVPYLRQALHLMGSQGGSLRADLLEQLGNSWLAGASTGRGAALRSAIECHAEAAEIYRSMSKTGDWARLEFNLGNSCCELSEITGEDHWQEAVFHYQQSLQVRTREKYSLLHAAVLDNLGTAHRRLGAIEESIRCYRSALRVYPPATHPDKHAALRNNLGNACLSLPDINERSAARNARRALLHFERARRLQSRNTASRAFGITEYNRAQAYFRLARWSPGDNLELAAGCLEAAAAAFHSCGEDRYSQLIAAQLERIGRA